MMMIKGYYHRIRLAAIHTDIRSKELRAKALGSAVNI